MAKSINTNTRVTVDTTDPTADSDVSGGYQRGDIWINESTPEMFVCTVATEGAATWVSVAAPAAPAP